MTGINLRKNVARHIIFIAALAVIPMLWYGSGPIADIGLDLQLTPRDFLENVFYGWQSKHSLGTTSNASGWVFPPSIFFNALPLTRLPDFLIVRIWYSLILFSAGVTMYLYINYLLKNHCPCDPAVGNRELAINHRLACAFVGAVGYMANPYVVLHFNNGHFLLPYATLPLQLLIVAKGLKSGRLYYAALLALSAILVSTNPPIVLINYIVITLFALWYIVWIDAQNIAKKLRFVGISFFLIGLNLLWYFAPTLLMLSIQDTVLTGALAQESWTLYGSYSSFAETLRLLGIWWLYAGDVQFGFYRNNILATVTTYLLPIMALLPLIFLKKKQLLYFPIILIIFGIFMATGGQASSPFKPIYVYFYANVPLFSMFRNGYKFVGIIAFAYVSLISIFLYWLANRSVNAYGERRVKYLRHMAIAIFLISALPLFRGSIFGEKNLVQMPSYWKDAAMWLNRQQGQFRIALFPDQYFDTYKWGTSGFMASAPYVSQDMVFNSTEKSGNEIIQALYYPLAKRTNPETQIFRGDTLEDTFCKLLPLLNVRYVIQRNDIDTSIYKVSRPKETKRFLDAQECLQFRKRFGELDIYETRRRYLPRIYVPEQSYYVPIPTKEIR